MEIKREAITTSEKKTEIWRKGEQENKRSNRNSFLRTGRNLRGRKEKQHSSRERDTVYPSSSDTLVK